MSIKKNETGEETVFFYSLGCPKNQVDSEVMVGILLLNNIGLARVPEEADYCIINTCGFINEAIEESAECINEVLALKKNKNSRLKKVIVAGCLINRVGYDNIRKQFPDVDCFIDVNSPERILEAIRENENEISSDRLYLMNESTPRVLFNLPGTAYVKISEGCSNECSFCTIPYIRGSYRSRTVSSVVNELKNLEEMGIQEIILISQDTTYYGKELGCDVNIISLLKEIEKNIKKIPWIRLLYLNPDRFNDQLLEFIRKSKRILPYFDLPIQHISDYILKRMGRLSGGNEIRDKIRKIKEDIPGAAVRATFIAGFPGETLEMFDGLVEFIVNSDLDRIGVFKYSDEKGTRAFELDLKVPPHEIERRFEILYRLGERKLEEANRKLVGKTISMKIDLFKDGKYIARTKMDAPEIDSVVYLESSKKITPGEIVKGKINKANAYYLYGKL